MTTQSQPEPREMTEQELRTAEADEIGRGAILMLRAMAATWLAEHEAFGVSERHLTPRKIEIVRLKCVDGMTNDEAGFHLGIAGQTVKNHTTLILRALGEVSMNRVCYRYGRGEIHRAAQDETGAES